MKYYEFISDSKINVLLPQVPQTFYQKFSAEIGIDIGIFKGSVKSEKNTLTERVAKLKCLSKYICDNEPVGTLTQPDIWVLGQAKAHVGYAGNSGKVIIYTGEIVGGRFMLAGSSGHVVGSNPDDDAVGFGFSFLPRLESSLGLANMVLEGAEFARPEENRLQSVMGVGNTLGDNWHKYIQNPWKTISAPPVEIEFLAKRLLVTGASPRTSLLATPLYVARLD